MTSSPKPAIQPFSDTAEYLNPSMSDLDGIDTFKYSNVSEIEDIDGSQSFDTEGFDGCKYTDIFNDGYGDELTIFEMGSLEEEGRA